MGLINEKDRNIVANGINAVASSTFKLVLILIVGKRSLADRAGKNFQQVAVNHNEHILTPVEDRIREIESWRMGDSHFVTGQIEELTIGFSIT